MTKSKNKKICIVVHSLSSGGAEKSSALLSQMLYQLGHEIHIVSIINNITYDYKGTLFNLGALKEKNDTFFGKINRLIRFKQFLKKHNFDFVIDNRTRASFLREFIISRCIYKPKKTIYCVRSFNLGLYFISNTRLAKYIYKDAYQLVGVSKGITEKVKKVYQLHNVTTIYNPISDFKNDVNIKAIDVNYALFFGRLDDQVKNISLLVEAYHKSKLSESNIHLKILGDGPDLEFLKQKVESYHLQSKVEFFPFMENPIDVITSAKFTLLTSRFEGFPRVVIESLALGTPVISVDCESGPKEIITNGHNGLLVENYNAQALADAMNSFIFDTKLYQTCKANAKQSVAQFSVEHIAKDWQKLLNTIDE